MKKANYAGFIPWVLVGNIIGGMFIVPMMPKVINSLCYKNKYNNDAALYYKGYMNDCYEIRVFMPKDASKLYLNNVDDERFPLSEFFDTAYNSNFFHNPHAEYTSFYCIECKKYLNVISFSAVYGSYEEKNLYLTVNREDMNNPQYGTMDNPIPVLKAVGVSEPIWFDGRDSDAVFMDKFYRNNVIQYLKYKMPKEEFERRFKGKTK